MLPPLLLANLVNLALVTLTMGALNTYTSLANAILIGLGIDFAVHLVGRYREKRGMGLGIEDAIARAWDVTGPPCTTAALTSAAGFLALAVGRFRGFSQLGILLAAGLMVCLLAMLVLLPVLLRLFDPEPPPRLARHVEGGDSRSSYRLAPIGLMAAVLTTGVAGAAWLPELGFEYDISQLRRVGKAYDELSELEQRLQREAYSPVVVTLGSRADVASEHRRLEKLVEEGRMPHVRQVLSIESLLPSDQAARITALAETARLVSSPNLRYLPPPLVKQLLPLRGYDARPVREDELPEGVLTLLGAAEGRHRVLLALQGNMWDMRESAALIDELQGVVQRPAGEFLAQGAMYRTVMRDIPIVAFLALFLVAVLTAIDTRNLTHALGALGALLAGMVWAGVGLYFAGVKLTLVNVVGVPILLGIGVDVVIHLLHRLREEGPGGVRRAYATAGVAATISTVTTIASFSSLLLAGNRGVRGLGLLVVVGLSAVSLVGALLLPLAWATGWRLTGRAPSQRPGEATEEA
jgi:predicted RND superfamily exporter protein